MPTITVKKHDLERLLGRSISLKTLDDRLPLVKGELNSKSKDCSELQPDLLNDAGDWIDTDENVALRVELNDTNRPDLWSVEGIARQFRDHDKRSRQDYDFYGTETSDKAFVIDPALKDIRAFGGGFLATGQTIDEDALLAFIEVQETLTRNFGRKRKTVSIGIYDGANIAFPIKYHAVSRDGMSFEPLPPAGEDERKDWPMGQAMTPAEILEKHPTGREYAGILEGHEQVPMLTDSEGQVLSFPPIINSAHLGRVTPGMSSLFVEVTGTVEDHVYLALNILAANLADRQWSIEPVTSQYGYDTARGREVRVPQDMSLTVDVPVSEFSRLLGERVEAEAVVERLVAYGVKASAEGDQISATCPSYRQDFLHPVDVIEDFAISRGYDSFEKLLPTNFTVGKLHPLTELELRVRDLMIGLGFEEAICNILTSTAAVRERMNIEAEVEGLEPFHGRRLVSIQNVMNLNYAQLREWLIPSLLEIEEHSAGATYPHKIFEVGEVAVFDPEQNLGSRTELRCAATFSDLNASFDSLQSVVYALLPALGLSAGDITRAGDFSIEPWAHPSFIEGRVAKICIKGEPVGYLGELHPEILGRIKARMPVTALELVLNRLQPFITL